VVSSSRRVRGESLFREGYRESPSKKFKGGSVFMRV